MKIEHEIQALIQYHGYPEVIAALARRANSDGRLPLFSRLNKIYEWMTTSPCDPSEPSVSEDASRGIARLGPLSDAIKNFKSERREVSSGTDMLKSIQDALGTEETGAALVEVARNAHKAEQAWANEQRRIERRDADLADQD